MGHREASRAAAAPILSRGLLVVFCEAQGEDRSKEAKSIVKHSD